jgi:quinolinate synthase
LSTDIINEIVHLKKAKNAVLLVHNYQEPAIQKLGDFVGDSLELAQKANTLETDVIVFAGAEFMAETAKILNPSIKVLIPSSMAKCPMAHMLSIEKVEKYRIIHPDAAVALYVNTTAETKAVADVCITSGNSLKIINALEEKKVLIGPDRNLAYYIQSKVPDKEIIPIPETGHCYVHRKFTEDDIISLKKTYPEAVVLVHPETEPAVQKLADKILSTSGMLEEAQNSSEKQFIISTEIGLVDQLRRKYPEKEFIPARFDAICVQQKKISVYNLYLSLLKDQYEILIPETIINAAYSSIKRMLDLSN